MAQWPYHDDAEIQAVVDVLRSGKTNYWSGEQGQLFEKEFAEYVGAGYALTVSNGTTALELALHALVRKRGAEVVVPCRTFMATASAVVTAGCEPVLADISAETLNVTVETLEARRTDKTAGVIVVHYAGLPCDMLKIMAWARSHGLWVIEDCAHAHGSRIYDQHVGTFGDIGCFSFCVGKTMSTGGEGGMVVTNNYAMYRDMGARRDHGRYQISGSKDFSQFKWGVEFYGTNLRLTEMQSAIGRIQLRKLSDWVARRNQIARLYDQILPGIRVPTGVVHGKYMHMIITEDRDRILKELLQKGTAARLGGCPNLGYEPVFGGKAARCPQADWVGERTLSLPVYPTMTDAEVENVRENLRAVVG